jgi:hypothetical protein
MGQTRLHCPLGERPAESVLVVVVVVVVAVAVTVVVGIVISQSVY